MVGGIPSKEVIKPVNIPRNIVIRRYGFYNSTYEAWFLIHLLDAGTCWLIGKNMIQEILELMYGDNLKLVKVIMPKKKL